MPERWEPVVSIDGDLLYTDTSRLHPGASPQEEARLAAHAIPAPVLKAAEDLASGVEIHTMTESSCSSSWISEWIQGDLNHTISLLMLGLVLLGAANQRYIGSCLESAVNHLWLTTSGISGIFCIGAAVYPWVVPMQGYLTSFRRQLEGNVQAIYQQMNKMLNMPEEMATMIKQLDVLIEEMAAQQKNVESMRSKTDWIPGRHKDGNQPDQGIGHEQEQEREGPPKVPSGILRKLF
eukprot:jgi/Botrbrau1/20456/Bobra.145_2s0020.1